MGWLHTFEKTRCHVLPPPAASLSFSISFLRMTRVVRQSVETKKAGPPSALEGGPAFKVRDFCGVLLDFSAPYRAHGRITAHSITDGGCFGHDDGNGCRKHRRQVSKQA